MNKAGYIVSLIGGVLAVVFSLLLLITGPVLFAGRDVSRFYTRNQDKLDEMWTDIGDYYGVPQFLKGDLDGYIDGYAEILGTIDGDDLRDIGEQHNEEAFRDAARLYEDLDAYIPKLKLSVIICVAASVIALIGAEAARRFRVAGGVMVISGGAFTLIFSLVASSIVPMALASLLLILGGVLQIVRQKDVATATGQCAAPAGGVQQ
ncbi:MAG: hypothetical protein ACM3S4_05280 [Burkholderiales bacterium]